MDPVNNFFTVRRLANGIQRGGFGLKDVPEALLNLIEREAWKHYVTDSGREYSHESFVEFVSAQPFEGLGSDIKQLERLCLDHPKAREALAQFIPAAGGQGRPNKEDKDKPDTSGFTGSYGTSRSALIARLKRDYPEHADRVIRGAESANAVAVELGIRPATKTIRGNDSAKVVAAKLRAVLTDETLAEIKDLL